MPGQKLKGLKLMLPEDLHKRLKIAAAVTGTTMAEIAVRAIENEIGE